MRFLIVAFVALLAGCPGGDTPEDPAVARGRQAWMGTCIACHNMNPAVDGAVGPAVKGATKALVEAKVLRGEYPAGYTPKRTTKAMPPQPALAGSIDDIVAFLNAK